MPPVSETDTAGAILATARIDQDLDVAELSHRLRLAPRQIEALENDQYDRLAGPTFIRGIIRNYAKALQIDPQPALAAYERTAPKVPGLTISVPTHDIRFVPGSPTASAKPIVAGLLLLVLLVIGGAAWFWYTGSGRLAQKTEPAPAKVQQDAPPAGSAQGGSVQPPAGSPSDAPTETATPQASVPPAAGDAPVPTAQPDAGAAPPPPTDSAASAGQPQLRLTFRGESWVQVKDGTGKVLIAKLNPAGSEQVLTGKPPFSLVIGNAASVRVTYKDKPVNLAPHIEVNVARLKVQ